jgi:hypothetical protein
MRPGGVFRLWDVVYHFEPAGAEHRIERWRATGATDANADWSRGELKDPDPEADLVLRESSDTPAANLGAVMGS